MSNAYLSVSSRSFRMMMRRKSRLMWCTLMIPVIPVPSGWHLPRMWTGMFIVCPMVTITIRCRTVRNRTLGSPAVPRTVISRVVRLRAVLRLKSLTIAIPTVSKITGIRAWISQRRLTIMRNVPLTRLHYQRILRPWICSITHFHRRCYLSIASRQLKETIIVFPVELTETLTRHSVACSFVSLRHLPQRNVSKQWPLETFDCVGLRRTAQIRTSFIDCGLIGAKIAGSLVFKISKMVDILVAVVLFLWLTYLWENYLGYRQVTLCDSFF